MNWLYWLLAQVVSQKKFTGLIPDPRPESEKKRDYLHEERLFAGAADPFANPKIIESPFPYENQYGTGSCVPHAVTLALGIERKLDGVGFVRLSQLFVYRLRKNYPQAGSWLQDIFNICAKFGSPLFTTLPTKPTVTEASANTVVLTAQMYTEAEIYRGKEYYFITNYKDISELAKVASAGHGVPVIVYARYDEYAFVYPKVVAKELRIEDADVVHNVTVLPTGGFWENGIRYVAIQDSALFGGFKIRYLSEEFIAKRTNGAAYWDTVKIIGSGVPPKYTFTKILKYGSRGEEVRKMQLLLISEGLLPTDCATGNFFGRTLAGLHAFQNKYAAEILLPIGLDAPTDVWGSRCIAKANQLCSGN